MKFFLVNLLLSFLNGAGTTQTFKLCCDTPKYYGFRSSGEDDYNIYTAGFCKPSDCFRVFGNSISGEQFVEDNSNLALQIQQGKYGGQYADARPQDSYTIFKRIPSGSDCYFITITINSSATDSDFYKSSYDDFDNSVQSYQQCKEKMFLEGMGIIGGMMILFICAKAASENPNEVSNFIRRGRERIQSLALSIRLITGRSSPPRHNDNTQTQELGRLLRTSSSGGTR